jgi:hypothetical protein
MQQRPLLTGLGLAAAAAVVLARFRRRKPPPPQPPGPDPAAELKQKLAESRGDESPAGPEPASGEAGDTLDERRRAVHDRARAAIDDMLGGENLPGEETD